MEQPAEKAHHFLVSAIILFTSNETPAVMSMPLNCAVTQKTKDLPVQSIARMQQAAQMQFHNRHQDGSLKIIDVVINNIMYVGEMTQEEFTRPPEGMTVQEQEAVQKQVQDEIAAVKDTKAAPAKKTADKPDLKVVGAGSVTD